VQQVGPSAAAPQASWREASANPAEPAGTLGVVIIGRNEGERLLRCLASTAASGRPVVYVDSGSSDDSVANARSRGAVVLSLDMSTPFTAARARNAGFEHLCELHPSCRWVQFVDGDCELFDDWIESALAFLASRPDVAVACGRLSERHPDRSIYNYLCDQEWDRPPGRTLACGGIFMIRRDAFAAVGGFNPGIVAGEEPDLCRRLRANGWVIWRLANRMAWHDADMLRFSQWWKRSTRSGYAYAQAASLPGVEWPNVRARLSICLWAAAIPLAIAAASLAIGWPALALALVYPLQVARLTHAARGPWRLRWARAAFLVLARFAEFRGLWQFWRSHRAGLASSRRFDYKT
jgi:GT2 family glycosyltransferase